MSAIKYKSAIRANQNQPKLVRITQVKQSYAPGWCKSSILPVPEIFFQPEQADDGFAVVDLALTDPIHCVGQRQFKHLQKLAGFQLTLLQRQASRQKIFDALVAIADARIGCGQMLPFARNVARFLQQLALSCYQYLLTMIYLSRRDLEEFALCGVAVLTFHDQ